MLVLELFDRGFRLLEFTHQLIIFRIFFRQFLHDLRVLPFLIGLVALLLELESLLVQLCFVLVSLLERLDFNLQSLFFKHFVLQVLLELEDLLIMHLLFDGFLLLKLVDLDLHLDHFFALAVLALVNHELEAISPFAVLFGSFEEVLLYDLLLIELSLQSRDLFLEKIDPLGLHALNASDLLVLLLHLYLVPTLDLLLQLLHLLQVLHLESLVLITELLYHGSQLLGILILRPFEFAEFLVCLESIGAKVLVVSLGALELLLKLIVDCAHLLRQFALFQIELFYVLPDFDEAVLVLVQNMAHVFVFLAGGLELGGQVRHLRDPLRKLRMAITQKLLKILLPLR